MRLFENKKQILIFAFVCFAIFSFNIFYKYYEFKKFIDKKHIFLDAKVEKLYEKINKKGKKYTVVKLNANRFSFYTTIKNNTKSIIENKKYVNLGVTTKNVKFFDYIKGVFYMPSFELRSISKPLTLKDNLVNLIDNEHDNDKIKEFYRALYFALPIGYELRNNVTNWGVAHIIAISGFHLGLLFGFIYFFAYKPYKIVQNKYFPYKNIIFEISFFIFILMGFYLWILDFSPSFLRSFCMSLIAFLLLSRGFKLFKFENLLITIILAVAFNPKLMFSIGFYFSNLGVFFIFLYVYHFGDKKDFKNKFKILLHTFGLEIFVFSAMNVPIFYFFHQATLFQLSVIPLGYIFVLFYPTSIVLHIIGIGNLFDGFILKYIDLAYTQTSISIPLWAFIIFNILICFSIKFKKLAILIAMNGFLIFLIPIVLALSQ